LGLCTLALKKYSRIKTKCKKDPRFNKPLKSFLFNLQAISLITYYLKLKEARIKLKAKDEAKNIPIESDKDIETNLTMAPELNLQIEIDRLAIQTFIKKMMPKITAESLAEIDQIKLDILTPSTQSLKESNKMIEISDVMNGLDKRNLNKSMELSSDMKRESSTLSRKSITNEMGTGTGDNFTAPSTPKTHDSSRSSIKNKKLK
jgi:hypothetical protein